LSPDEIRLKRLVIRGELIEFVLAFLKCIRLRRARAGCFFIGEGILGLVQNVLKTEENGGGLKGLGGVWGNGGQGLRLEGGG
jgi:hypothetical protein